MSSKGAAARSKYPLGHGSARLLHLLSVRLALIGCGRVTGRPTTASGARASYLQSRRFHCLWQSRRNLLTVEECQRVVAYAGFKPLLPIYWALAEVKNLVNSERHEDDGTAIMMELRWNEFLTVAMQLEP